MTFADAADSGATNHDLLDADAVARSQPTRANRPSVVWREAARRVLLALSTSALVATSALAQPRPGPLKLTTHALRGGAYWVEGGRSNSGFVVGDHGVVVLDTEIPDQAARLALAEIAKVTSKPISAIVVTHADPDHVGGLPSYPAAPVLMQENARTEVLSSAADPAAPAMYKAMYNALLPRLPIDTIAARRELTMGGVHMVLIYVGPAHTAGDIVMYLPDLKIVYGGDILVNYARYPVIHLGGSTLGWMAAMRTVLALDAETYVPGHGQMLSKAELQARLRDAEQRREQIKAMFIQGKSLDEIKQALPEAVEPMFLNYTETVYAELSKGYPPPSPPWANVVKR